ncbi:hypothetical protein ASPWEDRAFT_346482 [Aspergillus wentii DTO 134E9]|uniref:Uncharacterized protein n=1 Tax=Aspergillus wentii DTO 134E9 TaxID=1073089 RepID=A0A1L9RVG1_ASPWE|nr:uncharacterized protein ASPWEDRAFT_346482 [Aspergillus wentii DTO 134E9]KAI9928815.1 hypothetical protein MW887_002036 [Aspergillus wentii]OJJ38916.1 hypothetical protein ASPWEDRAFT_346482 [Aspergillus wentii DTO 134E9]
MAVKTIDITAPASLSKNPNMNKRWPPLADKTSLPFKLTALSRQKLAREATAADPDIRRCLGHFRLHCTSMEWAQKDMTSRINSFDLEDDTESEDEEEETKNERQAKLNVFVQQKSKEEKKESSTSTKTETTNTTTPAEPEPRQQQQQQQEEKQEQNNSMAKEPTSTETEIHVQFEVPARPPSPNSAEKDKENGLLEKGRSCLEKTVQRKHFWPSPGQCLPVRISG